MMTNQKRILSSLLAFFLVFGLSVGALAAEAPARAGPDPWAAGELLDAQAMDLTPANWETAAQTPLTAEQTAYILKAVGSKLSLLGLSGQSSTAAAVAAPTRGAFLELLFDGLKDWAIPGAAAPQGDAMAYMVRNGILKGNASGDYMQGRACTVQEALLFSGRLVSCVYNALGQASDGLLWKAVNGDNTLYLLGTIHVDKGNVYPFSKNLLTILSSCQEAIFEVDFNDQEGIRYSMQNQVYTDGTTLKDHIPAALYSQVVQLYAKWGVSEETIAPYRAWVIASGITTMAIYAQEGDTDQTAAPMVIDQYVYDKACAQGSSISQVEGYQYQTDLFNSMSDSLQADYLQSAVDAYLNPDESDSTGDLVDAMLNAWKNRDPAAFDAVFAKDASLAAGNEFMRLLFVQRDAHMAEFAASRLCLKSKLPYTGILVVGAGHMVGKDGVVNRLRALGYSVELVPLPQV